MLLLVALAAALALLGFIGHDVFRGRTGIGGLLVSRRASAPLFWAVMVFYALGAVGMVLAAAFDTADLECDASGMCRGIVEVPA
ncbi:hypothetical protein B2G71_14095 [Novosphingobium sp. PC22D]|uniref:hypothetical protein n=1 Tax=Novosphingobium sp. PC22D TaxID=1962403 RepID=UPI000BF03FCA|nr:hypothetical protein [Novosphingobium sp. PC22D]PEQ11914.1 hypothetical protein B2G71_14095 [Novosphingobium sp. PC22D]